MRIIYVSGAIFPSEVSHTLSKVRVCQAFVDDGHNVILSGVKNNKVIIPDSIPNYYGVKGGFDIFLKKTNLLWDNKITRKFYIKGIILSFYNRLIINKYKPDIIYSRLTISELILLPKSVPIIYEMHSLGGLRKGFLARSLFKYALKFKNFKRIVVTTNSLAQLLKKEVSNIDIVVARLSAEKPFGFKTEELINFKKLNFRGGNSKFNVGYTGYLDNVGLRGTEVICKVAANFPDVSFHIVGGEQEIVKYWIEKAKKYNVHKNIHFYGFRNPAEMPYFLLNFDLVMAPLQYKPNKSAPSGAGMSPLKIPQYMAYRCAIVASDIPAHREILRDNENASLVKCDDINSWTEAIRILLSDKEKRASFGSEAYQSYLSDFTSEGRIKKILNGF